MTLRQPGGDDGSSVPLILLCFLIAAVLVSGVTAASAAFLRQRDLQTVCDGAALAAANSYDPAGLSEVEALPVAKEKAQGAALRYVTRAFPGDASVEVSVDLDAELVVVTCARMVQVPFGAIFGWG